MNENTAGTTNHFFSQEQTRSAESGKLASNSFETEKFLHLLLPMQNYSSIHVQGKIYPSRFLIQVTCITTGTSTVYHIRTVPINMLTFSSW